MQLMERAPKETARDYAIRVLRHNIITTELEPGAMVSENELSKDLGLSRTPVREALIEMAKSGIVEIFPQHGSMISKIDYAKVDEARFIRGVTETAVVQELCDIAEPADIRRLEENLSMHEMYLARGYTDKLLAIDNDFHRLLFQIGKKTTTYELILILMPHFERVRHLCISSMPDNRLVEDHRAVVEAIRARNKEEAAATIQTHLSRHEIDKDFIRRKYARFFAD